MRPKTALSFLFAPALFALLVSCGDSTLAAVKAARLAFAPETPIGQAFDGNPAFKNVVWESYKDEQGRAIARVSAEYKLEAPLAGCPAPAPGLAPAYRVFLVAAFSPTENGRAMLAAAHIDAYSEKGYYESYPADEETLKALFSGQASLTCEDLFLPSYL